MKKIIGCILLVIPLACANPSHTESPNHMHHTALATPDDKQEEDSNADTISAKIARHTGFTSTGKVKAVDYADLYFRSQELIAHVYVKTGQRVRKGDLLADLTHFYSIASLERQRLPLHRLIWSLRIY